MRGEAKTGPRKPRKRGPWRCRAPDGARGRAKKKGSPAPPRSAVRGGDFLRGPVCPEANTTSNFALGCILSQRHEGRLHPVAFHSRKMSPAERNHDIHDKEMLVIVDAFKVSRHYCHGARTIPVYTDHNNLKYFMEAKTLNGRQARWAAYLSQFDFKVIYRPGS